MLRLCYSIEFHLMHHQASWHKTHSVSRRYTKIFIRLHTRRTGTARGLSRRNKNLNFGPSASVYFTLWLAINGVNTPLVENDIRSKKFLGLTFDHRTVRGLAQRQKRVPRGASRLSRNTSPEENFDLKGKCMQCLYTFEKPSTRDPPVAADFPEVLSMEENTELKEILEPKVTRSWSHLLWLPRRSQHSSCDLLWQ